MKQISKLEKQLIDILVKMPWSIDVIKASNNYFMASVNDDPFACSCTGMTKKEAIENVKQLLGEQLLAITKDYNRSIWG